MKRRLPTINQGESVLVAISLPPVTVDTNRQAPSAAQPASEAAARHATLIAASTQASGLAAGVTASPPNSTANAANAVANLAVLAAKRLHHPRAVVCGIPSRSAGGRTPERPAATSAMTSPIDSTTSSRPTSTNAGNRACVFWHGPQRARATKIR
jgi:hypothetical protein